MRSLRLSTLTLSLVLSLAMMACKDSPTTPPPSVDASALKGTWLTETVNGVSVVESGGIWTFTGTRVTFTDALRGCRSIQSYTTSGTTINATYIENDCGPSQVGSTETVTWSISGTKLTLKSGGTTAVLRKVAGNDRVIGSWIVTKVNGQAFEQGAGMQFYMFGSTMEIFTQPAGGSACKTTLTFTNNGTLLSTEVTEDLCDNHQPGAQIPFTWTMSGETLRLTDVTGLVLEMVRL